MAHPLNKPVKRQTDVSIRDAGQHRDLIVILYPSGIIGLRPKGTRREETIPLDAVYDLAVKARVAKELSEKKARRRA